MARMKNYKTQAQEEAQVRQLVREYWDSLEEDPSGGEQGSFEPQRSSRRR